MTMRPDIILGVQQPDFVNTLAQSTRAAGMANQNKRQNALAQVFQDHGPGIANGDKNALNILAQHDPQAALGFKQTQQTMKFDQDKMRMLRDEAKRAAQMHAVNLSAAERQQAAEHLQGILQGAAALYQQGDRAGFQSWVQQNGLDPAQYPFDQFPSHLAKAAGTIEALTEAADYMAGPEPLSGPGKVQADIDAGLLPEDTPLRNGPLVQIGDAPGGKPRTVDPNTIEASDAFDGSDTEGALSVSGIGADLLNTIGEAAWLGQAAPEIDKAQTALNSLSTKTMLGLSAEFPGRPSNLTRERIEELTIRPSELKTGPGRARNKTQDMLRTLEGSIAAANAVMLDPIYSRQEKAQAQTALRQLSQLFADYKALEQSLQAGNADDDIDAIADKWAD